MKRDLLDAIRAPWRRTRSTGTAAKVVNVKVKADPLQALRWNEAALALGVPVAELLRRSADYVTASLQESEGGEA